MKYNLSSLRNICLRWQIKRQIRRDERFLLQEGLRRAREQGIEIKVADQYVIVPPEARKQVYFPPQKGGVDVSYLMSLVADKYPVETKRWLENKKRLDAKVSPQ